MCRLISESQHLHVMTKTFHCNRDVTLEMYIIANLFMRCSSSPCCKFMCAILCCCVYANFGLYGASLTLCVMTFMYNCWNMLLTSRLLRLGENRIYLNEGVTQRKLLQQQEQLSWVEMQCFPLLLLLWHRESRLFFLCAQILISFLSALFFRVAISSEIDFVVGYFYHCTKQLWSDHLDAIFWLEFLDFMHKYFTVVRFPFRL